MRVMLQCRFDPALKPEKKRVVACGTKLLDTIETVRSSWAVLLLVMSVWMLLINNMQQLNILTRRRLLVLLFPNTRNMRGVLMCINQKVVHRIFF
jgi:hypothetical protein